MHIQICIQTHKQTDTRWQKTHRGIHVLTLVYLCHASYVQGNDDEQHEVPDGQSAVHVWEKEWLESIVVV